jgi:hypothetical protein
LSPPTTGAHYRAEDAVAEAYAMVFLVGSGFAQQTDVARAFDVKVGSREARIKNIDRTSVRLAILR